MLAVMSAACTAFACVRPCWVVTVWHCSAVTYHLDSVLAPPADAAKPCSTPPQRSCLVCLPPAHEPFAADRLLMTHHVLLSCQSLACTSRAVKVRADRVSLSIMCDHRFKAKYAQCSLQVRHRKVSVVAIYKARAT